MTYLYTTTLILGTLSPLLAAFCACKWLDANEKAKEFQRYDLRGVAAFTFVLGGAQTRIKFFADSNKKDLISDQELELVSVRGPIATDWATP